MSSIRYPPHQGVTFVKNVLIPMRDGVILAADMHMPAGDGPFPLVLEYIPYRKDDQTPYTGHHYEFAKCGYIGCRIDIRGTGASEGINTDEYVVQEQEDGYDAIEWLAQQPWCNGQIAMYGISYGGFVCYQVATHQPPHLKAIIPVDATDDRYTDDCHYRGGLFRCYYDFAAYGAGMIARNALPPYPEFNGANWLDIWEHHLAHNQPYMLTWLDHQTDDPYWKPGSLRGQYDKVLCPTFIIGGWRDGYMNTILRTYAQLKERVPTRAWIGPWDHSFPNNGVPGPRVNHIPILIRWLDHYLKGINNGAQHEPPVQVYMQSYDPPRPDRTMTSGAWRAEADWPVKEGTTQMLFLRGDGRMGDAPDAFEHAYDYHPAVGLTAGLWSAGVPFGLPSDQRADEAYSLVFTSDALTEPRAILGWAHAQITVSSSAEVMAFVASLSDVAPDGASALIAKGALNGTRRESLVTPTPLTPDERYALDIEIDCTGWVFRPGHRIRLSIASSDYPNLWPTPLPGRNTLHSTLGQPSLLTLPVVPLESSLSAPAYEEATPAGTNYPARTDKPPWRVVWDVLNNRAGIEIEMEGRSRPHPNVELMSETHMHTSVSLLNPADVGATGISRVRRITPDMDIDVTGRMNIRSTVEAFHLTVGLDVKVDGLPHFSRRWTKTAPRVLL